MCLATNDVLSLQHVPLRSTHGTAPNNTRAQRMPRSCAEVKVTFRTLASNCSGKVWPTEKPQEMPLEISSLPQPVERGKSLSAQKSALPAPWLKCCATLYSIQGLRQGDHGSDLCVPVPTSCIPARAFRVEDGEINIEMSIHRSVPSL